MNIDVQTINCLLIGFCFLVAGSIIISATGRRRNKGFSQKAEERARNYVLPRCLVDLNSACETDGRSPLYFLTAVNMTKVFTLM